ncbi:MAG: MFS transporter [Spirosomaceae bacterium]|jgi:MFS family permease|nr:MFS transporter [Spirosomataceae bacterium]
MNPPSSSIYNLQFWLLCFSNFLFSASFSMMIPELPEHLSNMGGQEYIGYIIALFTLTAGLARPFSGKVTDTIGRVPVMAFGSIVCCIGALCYPFVHVVWAFLLLRLLHGFSTGTKPTATAAYIADIVPENRRGEAAGMLGIFTATGMSIAPTMGSYITLWFGINTMFYLAAVFALLSIAILLNMKETLAEKRPFRLGMLKIGWEDLFEPRVLAVFIVMFSVSFASGVILTLIPDLSKTLGIENKGLFFTVYTVASLAVRVFASKVSDTHGRVPVLLFSVVVLAIGMAILGFTQSEFGFWAAAILFGVSWGLNTPTLTAWTIDLSHPDFRGRALATMYIALEAGIGVGAWWSGWWYGGDLSRMSFAFYVSAVLGALSFGYLLWWRNQKAVKVELHGDSRRV